MFPEGLPDLCIGCGGRAGNLQDDPLALEFLQPTQPAFTVS
jgi:hypothetical protein